MLILKRSRLRNKCLKNNNEENRNLYTKQRNYCVSLLRKSKKADYENLDEGKVSDNKPFWRIVKASLSEKFNARERISLSENGDIVKNLNISQYSDFDPSVENVKNPSLKAILKYKKHPSILVIRTKCNRNGALVLERSVSRKLKQKLGY